MATRVLYKAADGSWRAAEPSTGAGRLYTLKQGERWALLDDDRVMVVHPDRPPKVVYPDGRVEEIEPTAHLVERISPHARPARPRRRRAPRW